MSGGQENTTDRSPPVGGRDEATVLEAMNRLQAELDELRRQYDAMPPSTRQQPDARRRQRMFDRLKRLRDRHRACRARRADLEAHEAEVRHRESLLRQRWLGVNRQAEQLREKKRKLKEWEAAYLNRRQRLHKYKSILDEKSGEVNEEREEVEALRERCQHVLRMREDLAATHRMLEATEHRMMRRWKTQGALGLTAAVVVVVGFVMAMSFGLGYRLADPTWVASAVVVNESQSGGGDDRWLETQRAQLMRASTLTRAIHRMAGRNVVVAESPDALRQRISPRLTLHEEAAGRLRIELRGENRQVLPVVLGSLAEAFVAETRHDHAALDQTGKLGIVRQAAVSAAPVDDPRLRRSLLFLLVGTAAASVIVLLFRLAVGRSLKRLTADGAFNDVRNDERWSQISDGLIDISS